MREYRKQFKANLRGPSLHTVLTHPTIVGNRTLGFGFSFFNQLKFKVNDFLRFSSPWEFLCLDNRWPFFIQRPLHSLYVLWMEPVASTYLNVDNQRHQQRLAEPVDSIEGMIIVRKEQ